MRPRNHSLCLSAELLGEDLDVLVGDSPACCLTQGNAVVDVGHSSPIPNLKHAVG